MKHYETQLNKYRLNLSASLWTMDCRDCRGVEMPIRLLTNITECLLQKIKDLEDEVEKLKKEKLGNNSPNPQYFAKSE